MATVDKLTRSRRAMKANLLLAIVVFGTVMMMLVVEAIDWHWLALVVTSLAFFVLLMVFGPLIYSIEQRPYNKVRLHRPIGVVDIDLSQPYEVRARWGSARLRANGHTYPIMRSLGSPSAVDEWLRQAAR